MTGVFVRLDTVDLHWTLYSSPYSSGYSSQYSQPQRMMGDGKWAVATLKRGKADLNPKGTGTAVAVKKGVATAHFPSPRPSPSTVLMKANCLPCWHLADTTR